MKFKDALQYMLKDKRVRVVVAEPKLLQALSDYAELLKHSYRQ